MFMSCLEDWEGGLIPPPCLRHCPSFSFILSIPLKSRTSWIQRGGLCTLFQWGLERNPSRKWIWCIL